MYLLVKRYSVNFWRVGLFILSVWSVQVVAHSLNSLHINQYGIADGLPDSTINAIAQDGLGFIWFGTDDGLVRFDGVNFTKFNQSNGLENRTSQVTQLFVDTENNLWVTFDCSVHVLQPNEQRFKYVYGFEDINSINKTAFQISQVSPHMLSILTTQGVYLFNPQQPMQAPTIINTIEPLKATLTANNKLLFASDRGFYALSSDRSEFIPTQLLPKNAIITQVLNANNRIYVATSNQGLYELNQQLEVTAHYSTTSAIPIRENYITSLAVDNSARIWVGFYSRGVQLLQDNAIVKQIRYDQTDSHSLSSNLIKRIFVADNGDVWLGTERGGINHFRKNSEQLYHLKHSVLEKSPLSGNDVTAIAADKYLRGWIASNIDGISVYNPVTQYNEVIDKALAGLKIAKLHIDEQYTWVLDEQGLTKIDIDQLSVIATYTTENSELPAGKLVDWLPIDDEHALITHREDGISLFSLADLSFTQFTTNNSSLMTNQFSQMIKINNINWISSNVGLHTFDPFTRAFTHFLFTPQQNITQVNHLTTNRQGHIVLSTNNGMHIFDPLSKQFVLTQFPHKIMMMNIQATLVSDSGTYWSTLKNGLIEYRDNMDSFAWYTLADGLQGNEFNAGVSYRNSKGNFVFSGLNGITVLNPNALSKPPIKLKIASLKAIFKDGSTQSFYNIHEPKLSFERAVDVIQIRLGDTSFTSHTNNQFEYVGPEGMTEFDGFSFAFSPEPGNHQIQIINPSNNTNSSLIDPLVLSVKYPIPFLQTVYAYALIAAIGILVIYLSVWYRTHQVKQQAEQLKILVDKRTDDLRKQTEISRQQAQQLESIVAEKDTIFETISHELRTPLTLIRGPINQLRNYSMEPEAQTMLNILVRNADRLNTLVKKVFELSISDQLPDTSANNAITDLALVIKQQAVIFEPYLEQKQQTFTYPEFAPLKLPVPMYNLETIISNLLSNAIKYTPVGGHIEIKIEVESHFVNIHVIDSGIGIKQDEIKMIFNRFYRSASQHSEMEEGTGLGLAIVEQLVDKAEGIIKVDSKLEEGTQFTVILPNTLEQSYREIIVNDDQPCLLCIDDNHDILMYLENLFSGDYQVHTANTAVAGLTIAQDILPDLIISDIMMPEMDGIEFLQQLKSQQITNHIPVILLTAKNSQEARIQGLASAASDYINKPFEEEELRLKTRNIIAEQELIRRRYTSTISVPGKPMTANSDTPNIEEIEHSNFIDLLNTILAKESVDPNFGVQDLSAISGVSDRQLLRRIKSATGIGVSEFIRNYRLHRAAELLLSGASASLAAYESGFTSPSYFSTSFKKLFGITPKQFTQRQKIEDIVLKNQA